MRDTLGFKPMYTTVETFADFARSRGSGLLPPERVERAVRRAAAVLRVEGQEIGAGVDEGAKR